MEELVETRGDGSVFQRQRRLGAPAAGCMRNCRVALGIVPVMVPLKGVVPEVGSVSYAPSLYAHVPFWYARWI